MPNPTDDDPRATGAPMDWPMIMEVLDVLERHEYHQADSAHMGRAANLLVQVAAIYAGNQEDITGPGIVMPGGGWISGPST
jgi:hypothetical protein